MKPPRFTLRSLLVVVTIAAVSFGLSRRWYSPRLLTEQNAEAIKVGDSEWRVRLLLGPPHFYYSGNTDVWGYNLGFVDHAHFTFQNGRVATVKRTQTFSRELTDQTE